MRFFNPANSLFKATVACLTLALFTFLATGVAFAQNDTSLAEVKLTDKFTGRIADENLKSLRPDSGIINDAETWTKLRSSWRPGKDVEKVDFQNQTVLVEIVGGPNLVFVNQLKFDTASGDLKYDVASSRMTGPGFGYLIMVVPKANLKTVNGNPLNAPLVFSSPELIVPENAKPLANPAENSNPIQPPKTSIVVEPENSTAMKPETKPLSASDVPTTSPGPMAVGKESVSVEIVGSVRSTFVQGSARGMVAANNIVWELDFQQNMDVIQTAQKLGFSLARVKGELEMIDQAIGPRFLIKVTSLEKLDLLPPPQTAPLPIAENNTTQNQNTPQPTVAPTVEANPANAMPNNIADAVQNPGVQNTYRLIKLVTNDGQTQTIDPNGNVVYQSSTSQNQWILKPDTLDAFHDFVARTDWESVPRVTQARGKDKLSYRVTIETGEKVYRIFIDSTVVNEQPTMQEFFGLVGRAVADRE